MRTYEPGGNCRTLLFILAALIMSPSIGYCSATPSEIQAPWSSVQKGSQEILDGLGKTCQQIGQGSCNNIFHALSKFEAHQYDSAAADYESLIRLFPQSSELRFNLAECYYYLERYDEAIAAYRETARLKPSDGVALSNLGEVYWKLGRLDEAENALSRAVEAMPGLATAHYCFGVVLKDKGKLDEAASEYRKAITIEPGFAYAHCNLGDVLGMQGRENEALIEFLLATMLDSDNPVPKSGVTTTMRHMQDLEVAVRTVDSLNQKYPHFASGYYHLGQILAERGEDARAEAAFLKAATIRPDFSAAHCDRGAMLGRLNRTPEAITEYREAVRLDPIDPVPRNNLISAFVEQGDLDSAVAAARTATAALPNVAKFHMSLGELLSMSGQPEIALLEFREARRLDPESELIKKDLATSLYNQGNAFLSQERPDEAELSYREAISIRPNYLEAIFNLGNTLASKGKLDEAIQLWCKALQLQPDLERAVDNIRYNLIASGKSESDVTKFIDSVRASK